MLISCLPLSLVRGHRRLTKPRINTDSLTTSSIGDRRALHDLAALSLGDLHFIRSRVQRRARMMGRVGAAPGVCRESSFGSPKPTKKRVLIENLKRPDMGVATSTLTQFEFLTMLR